MMISTSLHFHLVATTHFDNDFKAEIRRQENKDANRGSLKALITPF